MPEVRALLPLRGSLHTEGTEDALTLNAHWVCRARVAQTQEPRLPPARRPGPAPTPSTPASLGFPRLSQVPEGPFSVMLP